MASPSQLELALKAAESWKKSAALFEDAYKAAQVSGADADPDHERIENAIKQLQGKHVTTEDILKRLSDVPTKLSFEIPPDTSDDAETPAAPAQKLRSHVK